MVYFYKIEKERLITGEGDIIPPTFTEYTPKSIDLNGSIILPDDLQVYLDKEYELLADEDKIKTSLQYLSDTDFYYARKIETGENVPTDVVTKRLEARDFLRSKGY